ncbi:SMI1/KNR4 family protein [Streptomyces sp. GZWMJZ-114]|uniref:SMI1/KNR4 family protein n=1 Tax=Streptomyces sp. GZWMJZ-114 TaxID=2494734 RepID=UPI001F506B89|nr:SMI1/KNR4 family protein [Streptomyces sp. GZWMJZ-114]
MPYSRASAGSPPQRGAFEAEHDIALPDAYRQFLTHIGGSGAAPFYGLMPLERCSLLVMNPREEPGTPCGFDEAEPGGHGRDLFLHVIEMGCTDVCVIEVTGPLTGRVLIGNSDGFWGPKVSSATDFLDWYERWLNHMSAGRDNPALELTSPQLRAHPDRHRMAPKIRLSVTTPRKVSQNPFS